MIKFPISLSIIIPHYNVAPYIDCLYRTLIPQLTEKVELILVEDCSTDSTREKMKQWEDKITHPNTLFIYLNNNLGQSGARNTAIERARGEYIWFIDSDDFIHHTSVAKVIHTIKQYNPDGIVFDFYEFDGNNGECIDMGNSKDPSIKFIRSKQRTLSPYTLNKGKEKLIQSLFDDAQMYPWSYIFKKSFWQAHPFPEGRKFEDVATLPKIIDTLDTLYYLPETLYYYRRRENSTLSAPTVNSCLDMGIAMRDLYNYFKDTNMTEASQISFFTFYLRMLRHAYGDLRYHNLLSKDVLAKYKQEESFFFKVLPWNRYRFLVTMHIYPIFKITSLFFFINKNMYTVIKRMVGKS